MTVSSRRTGWKHSQARAVSSLSTSIRLAARAVLGQPFDQLAFHRLSDVDVLPSVPYYDFKEFRPILNDFMAKKKENFDAGKEKESMDR